MQQFLMMMHLIYNRVLEDRPFNSRKFSGSLIEECENHHRYHADFEKVATENKRRRRHMTSDEWMLVGRAKSGDAHAFAKLYERYYRDLYYFALSYLGNETAAEDAVSIGVLKAYEHLIELRKTSSFKSWLFKIVANACKNALRERKKITPVDFDSEENRRMEQSTEPDYTSAEWKDILAVLSEKERLVITLTIFSGYSSAEAAKTLGMRAGTVRSLKSRGIEKIKKALK